MVLKKISPSLYGALGVYLPLITTNCAVLGVAIINVTKEYTFIQSVVNGFGTACGFTIAIVIMASVSSYAIFLLAKNLRKSKIMLNNSNKKE